MARIVLTKSHETLGNKNTVIDGGFHLLSFVAKPQLSNEFDGHHRPYIPPRACEMTNVAIGTDSA